MYFCLIYLHYPNEVSREYEILQCLGGFKGSRRTFRDGHAYLDKGSRMPATMYYIEAPAEAGTLLKLKGFPVQVLEEEPDALKGTDRIHIES